MKMKSGEAIRIPRAGEMLNRYSERLLLRDKLSDAFLIQSGLPEKQT